MVQMLNIEDNKGIMILETKDLAKMKEALAILLYVPNPQLKPLIIEELGSYLKSKFYSNDHNIKMFIAYVGSEVKGFVICYIHPHYTSYGRKCGTFGWLCAEEFEICKALMMQCEQFMIQLNVRKLRGPVNFPKLMGGMGIQTHGFDEPLISGVSFSPSESRLLEYLNELGYEFESEYTCLKVIKKTWEKGKKVDPNIKLKCLTLEEIKNMRAQVFELVKESFYGIVPDSSGFDEKFDEVVRALEKLPDSYYQMKKPFNPEEWSDMPEYREAWEECDMEKVIVFWPAAYDRTSNRLVGLLALYPDLFEIYLTDKSTRTNVDTAMVDKNYGGRGIFSALNNFGQINCNIHGITYFEGTYVWTRNSKGVNNERAIATIFPHCTPIRKHVVVEKNIRKSNR
jgi:hypothetical protein